MTGAGVALPGEAAARIEAEFLQIQEELAPTTLLGMKLARRLAPLTVRQDRAEPSRTARLRVRARVAAADREAARVAAADRLVETIEASPQTNRRQLLATPEGVDRLVAELFMLHTDLTGTPPVWSPAHHKRLDALFSFLPGDLPRVRPTRYSRALLGDLALIDPAEHAEFTERADRAFWVRLQVMGVIEAEIDRLTAHREALDFEAIEREREDAADLALDRQADLAARCEAAAKADPALDPDPAPEPPANPAPNPLPANDIPAALASFGAPVPAASAAPESAPTVAPVAPTAPRRPVPTVAFTPPRSTPGR